MTTRPQRPADYGALLKRDLPPARKQQPRQQSDADPAYLAMVRQCPCLRCGQDPAGEAAHVRLNSATHGKFGAKGKKPSDKWALPLCGGPHGCHAEHGIREIETAYPYRWSCLFAPRYTRSFEAALTLLPKLVYVEVTGGTDTCEDGIWPAVSIRWLRPGETDKKKWQGTVQAAPSFALAMCRAAIEVRARVEKAA